MFAIRYAQLHRQGTRDREHRQRKPSAKPEDDDEIDPLIQAKRRFQIKSAGMDDIRVVLRDAERRLARVRCATSYGTYVKEQENAKKLAKEREQLQSRYDSILFLLILSRDNFIENINRSFLPFHPREFGVVLFGQICVRFLQVMVFVPHDSRIFKSNSG